MVVHALATGLWGGLLALERRAFLQAMLCRPIVAATGVGALFGDLETGLFIGVFFELLHLGGASLGGAAPGHETLPAVAAAGLACAMGEVAGRHAAPAVWSIAVLGCAPLGVVGRRVETALDVRARKYLGRARDAATAGEMRRAARQNLRAMWPQFVFVASACAAVTWLGSFVELTVERVPPRLIIGLAWAYPVMTLVAASSAVAQVQARHRGLIAGVGVLIGAASAWAAGAS